ncbi:MAG TPA: hypothetical protein VH560_19435 [Polyangia bacterium]|nr:hypothetical protein [Polyangia bacterium]
MSGAAFGACTSSSGAGGTAGASASAGANGTAGSGGASGAGTAGSGSAGATGGAGTSGSAGTTGSDGGAGKPATNSCGVVSNLGAATVVMQSAAQGNGDRPTASLQGSLQWLGQLDNADEPNELDVQLYEGVMPFGASLAPMTIPLAGQGDFATCGACVIFHPMYVAGAPIHAQTSYIATGGTLTLTAVPTGTTTTLVGSLSNVTFEHVDIDLTTYATTKSADGCTSALTSATINVSLPSN